MELCAAREAAIRKQITEQQRHSMPMRLPCVLHASPTAAPAAEAQLSLACACCVHHALNLASRLPPHLALCICGRGRGSSGRTQWAHLAEACSMLWHC